MAGEAVLQIETHLPIPLTCDNATGIEKGALLKLADPATVSAVTTGTTNQVVGGIAAVEKIANNGETTISVYRGGIFSSLISGNVTVGDPLVIDGVATAGTHTGKLSTAAVNNEQVIGYALETGTDGETILWELRPTVMQLA